MVQTRDARKKKCDKTFFEDALEFLNYSTISLANFGMTSISTGLHTASNTRSCPVFFSARISCLLKQQTAKSCSHGVFS